MKLHSLLAVLLILMAQISFASKRRTKKTSNPESLVLSIKKTEENRECCTDTCFFNAQCCATFSAFALLGFTAAVNLAYNSGYHQGFNHGYHVGNNLGHMTAYHGGFIDGTERGLPVCKPLAPEQMLREAQAGYNMYLQTKQFYRPKKGK